MLFMVVERFTRGATPVYHRLREKGRMAPDGVHYVSSWVTNDMTMCYQVMECERRDLLDQWIANWNDIVDFDVLPVITSAQAATRVP
jgi:hypothetical protein